MRDDFLKLDLENQLQPTLRPVRNRAAKKEDAAAMLAAQRKFFGLDSLMHPARTK